MHYIAISQCLAKVLKISGHLGVSPSYAVKVKALHLFVPTETVSSLSAVFPLLCKSNGSYQWTMKKLAPLEIIYFHTAAASGCHLHLSNLRRIKQRQRWFNSMFPKCFEILVLKEVLCKWKKPRSFV